MRRSRHTDQEIAFILKEAENGIPVSAICASAYVSIGTFYRWRRRLGGLAPPAVARLRHIEEENAFLRAEVARLRQGVRAANPSARMGPVPRPSAPASAPQAAGHRGPHVAHRGSGAQVGRYAFVRTTH